MHASGCRVMDASLLQLDKKDIACIYPYVHASGCKMLAASLLQLDKKIIKFSEMLAASLGAGCWLQDASGCRMLAASLLQLACCKMLAASLMQRKPRFSRAFQNSGACSFIDLSTTLPLSRPSRTPSVHSLRDGVITLP